MLTEYLLWGDVGVNKTVAFVAKDIILEAERGHSNLDPQRVLLLNLF